MTKEVLGTLTGEPVLFLSLQDKDVSTEPFDTQCNTKMIWSMLLRGFVVQTTEPVVPVRMSAPYTGEVEELLHDLVCYALKYGAEIEYTETNTLERFVPGPSNISVYTDTVAGGMGFEVWENDRATGKILVSVTIHKGEYVYGINPSDVSLIKELWNLHIGSKKN